MVDLNVEDEPGQPWGFVDETRDLTLICEGAWLVVSEGPARAVAHVVEIEDGVVRVRPLPLLSATPNEHRPGGPS